MSYVEENHKTIKRFTEKIGIENINNSKILKDKRYWVTLKTNKLTDAVTYIKENEGLFHLATITAVDYGDVREVNYHFQRPNLIFTIKVRVPGDNPVVPSITPLINGATIYEREIYDLVGIVVEGHPNPKRLLMTEEWPEGVFPLLKKWDVKSLRKAVDGEEWT